jgi:hypothetical protein
MECFSGGEADEIPNDPPAMERGCLTRRLVPTESFRLLVGGFGWLVVLVIVFVLSAML